MHRQILCILSGIEFHFEENFGKKIDLTEGYSKMLQIWLVFGKFFYQNISYVQNAYDIQNQHKKLSRITYVLLKNKICQNFTPGGTTGKISQNRAGGSTGENFDKFYFSIKHMLFDSVFYADSEYHMHFARKICSDRKICQIRAKFVAFCYIPR